MSATNTNTIQNNHNQMPILALKISLPIVGGLIIIALLLWMAYYQYRHRQGEVTLGLPETSHDLISQISNISQNLEKDAAHDAYKSAQKSPPPPSHSQEGKENQQPNNRASSKKAETNTASPLGQNAEKAASAGISSVERSISIIPAMTDLSEEEAMQVKSCCQDLAIVGRGSTGRVYKGVLRGQEVGIKKQLFINAEARVMAEQEVEIMNGKSHKNISRLIGWYAEDDALYLVYEYIHGCTLNDYLRGNVPDVWLNWRQGLKIALGIARGLSYLHSNRIIHVDIKPQNIMLDENMEAKIIDFGLSRVDGKIDETHRWSHKIAGTTGYWAPEYCMDQSLSFKHDVYSTGIVLLELVTGQKHLDNSRDRRLVHIPAYVESMIRSDRFEEIVDGRYKKDRKWGKKYLASALSVAKLGLLCVEKDKERRPLMDFVVKALSVISTSGKLPPFSTSVASSNVSPPQIDLFLND